MNQRTALPSSNCKCNPWQSMQRRCPKSLCDSRLSSRLCQVQSVEKRWSYVSFSVLIRVAPIYEDENSKNTSNKALLCNCIGRYWQLTCAVLSKIRIAAMTEASVMWSLSTRPSGPMPSRYVPHGIINVTNELNRPCMTLLMNSFTLNSSLVRPGVYNLGNSRLSLSDTSCSKTPSANTGNDV